MAATAGGVAVGSAVGHVAGEALTGMMFGRHRREDVQASLPQSHELGQEPSGPCSFEIKQFLRCAENKEALSECEQFNEALRECKNRNRLP